MIHGVAIYRPDHTAYRLIEPRTMWHILIGSSNVIVILGVPRSPVRSVIGRAICQTRPSIKVPERPWWRSSGNKRGDQVPWLWPVPIYNCPAARHCHQSFMAKPGLTPPPRLIHFSSRGSPRVDTGGRMTPCDHPEYKYINSRIETAPKSLQWKYFVG